MITRASIAWKRLTSGSINRQILGAAIIIGIGTLLVKLTGFAKDILVAGTFGLSAELDAYIMALTLISFPIGVIFNALQSSFIPVLTQISLLKNQSQEQGLLQNTVAFCLLIMFFTAMLFLMLLPWILGVVAYGFSAEKRNLVSELFWQLLPFYFFSGMNMLAYGVLQAGKKFWLSGILPVSVPALTIFLFWISGFATDIHILVWATILGSAIEYIVLQLVLANRGYRMWPTWGIVTPEMKRIYSQTLALLGGTLLMNSTTIIDQAFASSLDSGSITALTYGNKVPGLLAGLGVTALASAILPYFSEMVGKKDWGGCSNTFKRYAGLILMVTIPLVLIIAGISEPLVGLMFQRGAFDTKAVHLVALIQMIYLIQIPVFLVSMLAVKLISADGKNHILTIIAGINLVSHVALNWWFMQMWGIIGIAVAGITVYFISAVLCISYVLKLLRSRRQNGIC